MENINAAVKEINSLGETRKADTTHFINASYHFGKYHAYLDILKDLDMEQLVKCHDRCKDDCDKVLHGNLVSSDYKDYTGHLDHYAVEEMSENCHYINSIEDDEELSALFDALEEDEETEDE